MGRGKQIYMYELRLNSAELEADILIESFVNSQTADNVPGPEVGEFVSRNFTVTNPGSVSLTNVVVIDDNGIPDDRSDDFNPMPNLLGNELNLGDLDQDGELDPGEVWLHSTPHTAIPGSLRVKPWLWPMRTELPSRPVTRRITWD